MRYLLKAWLRTGMKRFLVMPKGQPRPSFFLMYHSVDSTRREFFVVSKERFRRQLEFLKGGAFHFYSFSDIYRLFHQKEALGTGVGITFDDGYEDNYTHAFPILREYQIPAIFFITTAGIGKMFSTSPSGEPFPMMDVSQLRELVRCGYEIGAHTHTHPKLPKLALDQAREEIRRSKKILEDLLGERVRYFAYPYGLYTQAIQDLVQEEGFEAAVSVRPGYLHSSRDVWGLPRLSVDRSVSLNEFRYNAQGAVEPFERWKAFWRGTKV